MEQNSILVLEAIEYWQFCHVHQDLEIWHSPMQAANEMAKNCGSKHQYNHGTVLETGYS
jgi:hypothetical protein